MIVSGAVDKNVLVIFIANGDEDEVFARLDENGFVIFIAKRI